MKYFLVILLIASTLLAQNTIRQIQKPDEVIIYLTGADVGMNFKANLKKGRNILMIDSLPSGLAESRIRVSTTGQTQIMSFQYKMEAKTGSIVPYNPQIKSKYDDSIKVAQRRIEVINSIETVLAEEENLIKNYKLVNTGEYRSTTKDLEELAKYYSKRIGEIKEERLDNMFEIRDLNEKIQVYNELKRKEQASPIPVEPQKDNYQLEVEVYAEEAGSNNFNVIYFTNQARWTASYDVKVKDVSSPAKIITKANVLQFTNMPWDDIKLTLSTRNPDQLSTLPILSPWTIKLKEPKEKVNSVSYDSEDAPLSPSGSSRKSVTTESKKEKPMVIQGLNVGTINRGTLAIEYSPTLKYNIPNDNKNHNITVGEVEVPTDYSYYAIPKLDTDAFLTANISDLSDLNLIASSANVYFENNLVGTTYINPQSTEDTIKIGLGRDKDIVIDRTVIKDYKEGKFLSSNGIREYGYEIKIKNNKKSKINITIEDQIPISSSDKITVNLEESSDAEIIPEKGALKWRKEIQSNKSEKWKFVFKIDAPENAIVK